MRIDRSVYVDGGDIQSFLNYIESNRDVTKIYFHNAKFDFEFIAYALFHLGFEHVESKKELTIRTFTTLISDTGQFYSATIQFSKSRRVEIWDSLKVLPGTLDKLANDFDLPIRKGSIDYTKGGEGERTEEQREYQRLDCEIMTYCLERLFKEDLLKMTTGSNAFNFYKRMIGKKNFERWFPVPDYDADIRQAYRGGYVYVNKKFKGKGIGKGIVLDVNSLYPYVMHEKPLPYGEGIFFEGKYQEDTFYPLYIQMMTCQFKLKKGKLPTIQLKNNLSFIPTEYIEDSGGEWVTLCLTNVDMELFFEHYNVFDIDYHSGWKFKATTNLFKNYVDYWTEIKIKAGEEGNKSMRTIAKLMLNSLYGKFALNPHCAKKIPYLKEDDSIGYQVGEKEERDPIYIPVGVFVTAWARYVTITAAQKCYRRFLYADTDSLHLIGEELPEGLEIDPFKLGAWKLESTFDRAKYLHAKCYVEEKEGDLNITVAGLPASCYKHVTYDNFEPEAVYPGKLKPSHVSGGVLLESIDFTIRK